MKWTNWITTGLAAWGLSSIASASVFFSIDVGSLQDEVGESLVNEGMLYLVNAGADGEFALPEAGSILGAGSDDSIVASWNLGSEASQGGEYIVGSGAVPYDNAWSQGDLLAILWFPNLTEGQNPADGEAYGFYRDYDGVVGDAWEMPQDGVLLHSLKFFAGDSLLVNSSDIPPFLAAASFGAGGDAGTPTIDVAGLSIGEPNPATATFSWNGSSVPGGGFRVERRLAGESDWTVLGSVAGDVFSYDDSSIGRGKDYEYRVVAVNGFGSEVSGPQAIETLRARIANIATRGLLGSGDQSLILGFTALGTGEIDLLARVQGPELGLQIPSLVAGDPTSVLNQTIFSPDGISSVEIGSNDNWGDTQLNEIKALFDRTFAIANSDDASFDSGMALTLTSEGVFTVVANDSQDLDGLALVEVFDATDESPNDATMRLVNLATRGFVGTGDNILIGGFIVDGVVDSKLLIRGVGPSLATPDFGNLNGVLADPTITLIRTDFSTNPPTQITVATNDNWEDAQNSDEIIEISPAIGAKNYPLGSKDSALLVDAVPGLYSFKLEGVDSGTGIGLIEVFLAD